MIPTPVATTKTQTGELAALRARLEILESERVFRVFPLAIRATELDSVETRLGGRRPTYSLLVSYEIGIAFHGGISQQRVFLLQVNTRFRGTTNGYLSVVYRGNPYDGLLAEVQVPVLWSSGGGRAAGCEKGMVGEKLPNKPPELRSSSVTVPCRARPAPSHRPHLSGESVRQPFFCCCSTY